MSHYQGEKIRTLLFTKKMKIEDLANAIDMTRSTVSGYINGAEIPRKRLELIAKALEVDVSEFNEHLAVTKENAPATTELLELYKKVSKLEDRVYILEQKVK